MVTRGPVSSRGGPDSGLCFCGLGARLYTCGYGAELNTPHSGDTHTLSVCLVSTLTQQTVSSVLSHLLCCVSDSTFVPAFTVSASMINVFFTGGKDPWENSFQPLALAGLLARMPGFHPGYSGSVPGQGIKILLQATTQGCLVEIRSSIFNHLFLLNLVAPHISNVSMSIVTHQSHILDWILDKMEKFDHVCRSWVPEYHKDYLWNE